ncbi:peptidoglycan recognition protein [Streptomyces sp. HNM0575]|uniref:peptidoglycan recognition protein family protein n=1 Tax=Streptomyces sp. HNM0575 TaxID=2716338 RepID=UPI00145DFAFF|nr:peptidoglycan recognition protein [Streptomyces sp. HNM0575]NLU75893.1 peptidoglycan recognition protein [Streptomyces sp. HNM0575]
MRALLVTSIGAACAGALLLPLAPTESAESMLHGKRSSSGEDAAPPAALRGPGGAERGSRISAADSGGPKIPGSTRSLPLRSGDGTRAGDKLLSAWEDDPSGGRRVTSRKVKPFSLVGVVWDDSSAVPPGRLQVQTRGSGTAKWSAWRTLDTHGDGTQEPAEHDRSGKKAVGATAPLWTGDSTAVRVRIVPDPARGTKAGGGSSDRKAAETRLPEGARLELVDPGKSAGSGSSESGSAGAGSGSRSGSGSRAGDGPSDDDPAKRPGGVLPELSRADTRSTYGDEAADATPSETDRAKDTRIGPRPAIVTRKGWGADETLREREFSYSKTVKAAFVHHSAETNDYSCADVPGIIRAVYRYHVQSSHWRDIGYNFLVDKCGKIYEGRAGGMAKPVMGAHTLGFNADTTGIAVLGTYSKTAPSKAAKEALSKLTAWKLGVHGVDASARVTLTSGGGSKYEKGKKVAFNAVSGHRDGFTTECPGESLYRELPAVRTEAARLQGRR